MKIDENGMINAMQPYGEVAQEPTKTNAEAYTNSFIKVN